MWFYIQYEVEPSEEVGQDGAVVVRPPAKKTKKKRPTKLTIFDVSWQWYNRSISITVAVLPTIRNFFRNIWNFSLPFQEVWYQKKHVEIQKHLEFQE